MWFTIWAHLSYFLKDFYPYLILLILSFFILIIASFKIYKSEATQNRKKLLLALVSTIFILILIYSSFEAYFRYRYDASDGLGFLKVNERWHKRHVVYNSHFFRDRDFDANKKEGVTRIGILGDSIAFGGGIKNVDDRFSNILEKKLKESGKNVEVYNLGTPGYDTEGEIGRYQSVRHLKFDILVWEYFLNDVQRLEKSTGTPIIIKNSKQGEIAQFLSSKSFFFDFLYWRLSSRYNKTLGELRTADLDRYKDEQQVADHKEMINNFIKTLDQDNTKVVTVIFPLLYFLGPDYPARDVHAMMSEHFKQNGAQVIDMLDYLKDKNGRDLWAGEFDSHPNAFVHSLVAEKLYQKILPLIP